MPVYGHQHSFSGPGRFEATSITQPAYQATPRTLGSTSTPSNDLRNSTTSGAGVSSSYSSNATTNNASDQFSRPTRSESSPSGPLIQRQDDDLPSSSNYAQRTQQSLGLATDTGSNNKNMSASGGMSLPGALQPGRPAAISSNTAPSSVPTLPPISTSAQPQQQQQFSSPSRASTASHSHSYSHSSPAPPYSDDASKYASTPTHKYMAAQTPQTATYSPLGLADIRPRADSGNDDGPPSAYPYQEVLTEPTNCNYLAPWAVYSFDWCKWQTHQLGLGESAGRMAIGSYLEDGHNYIQILDTKIVPDPEPDSSEPGAPLFGVEYVKTAEAAHSYPVTRMLWEPESSQKKSCDLLATSGDHLRLWSLPASATKPFNMSNSITKSVNVGDQQTPKLQALALLSNSKSPEHTAPLTSLDWNTLSPSLIITSSIDTTCTIWDIPSLTAKTQLIAHDKEVFDVRFCANSVDVFVSCGADGSVRMFDLRSLEHSTIIYEPSEKLDSKTGSPGDMSPTKAQQTLSHAPPLLRLAASPHDAHLLATFSQDSSLIRILDVRQPGQALLELQGHQAPVNCMEWSPSKRGMLASGADDSLVLVWDLLNQANPATIPGANGNALGNAVSVPENARGPAAIWQCDYEVNNISWAPKSGLTDNTGDWLGVSGGRAIWGVNFK